MLDNRPTSTLNLLKYASIIVVVFFSLLTYLLCVCLKSGIDLPIAVRLKNNESSSAPFSKQTKLVTSPMLATKSESSMIIDLGTNTSSKRASKPAIMPSLASTREVHQKPNNTSSRQPSTAPVQSPKLTSAPSCEPTLNLTERNEHISLSKSESTHNLRDYDLYFAILASKYPAQAAGKWLKSPNESMYYSPEHLLCLDQERQGNCHDPDSWKKSNDTARQSRHSSILKKAVVNSPGILAANDPWVWKSNISAYETIPFSRENSTLYKKRMQRILSSKRIHMIGDSLTRQWRQSMYCELVHIAGMQPNEVDKKLFYYQMHKGFADLRSNAFHNLTKEDVIVFNLGHHVGWKIGQNWKANYKSLLKTAYDANFGKVPDENIFFRTTTVRHFVKGLGDYDTNTFEIGSVAPNMHAKWGGYGGSRPEQPKQNLIAFDVFLHGNNSRKFEILDTSPMMLARGDASFDGCHFCLPGELAHYYLLLQTRHKCANVEHK